MNADLPTNARGKGYAAVDVNGSGINGCCQCMGCTSVTSFEQVHMYSKNYFNYSLGLGVIIYGRQFVLSCV